MAELNDRLKRLVSDEQSMKRVLDMASAIMERKAAAAPPAEPPAAPAAPPPVPAAPPAPTGAPDLGSVLSALLDRGGPAAEPSAGESPPPPGEGGARSPVSALAEALPQLMQALSGSGELVSSDRANLIRAMTPYLSERRVGSLDRAMRMANVTKAAKSALHTLGRGTDV